MGVSMPGVSQGYAGSAMDKINPATMPPIRAQLALISDNLLNALEQTTRIEDSILYTPTTATGGGPIPSPNSLQELVDVLGNRVLALANRLGRVADKL